MLRLYRRLYWYLDSWRVHDQISVSGSGPEFDRLRKEIELEEQRRERRLRRFRLLPPE